MLYYSTVRLSIDLQELSFTSGVIEPYYCSLALYDVKQRQKLSETFYFELNPKELSGLFKDDEVNVLCTAKRCLIPLGIHNPANTFIIIQVDKLFSGDMEKDIARYQKKNKKTATPNTAAWEEMGFIRQPFVWAALNLKDEMANSVAGLMKIEEFYPIRFPWTIDTMFDHLTKDVEVIKVFIYLNEVFIILKMLNIYVFFF